MVKRIWNSVLLSSVVKVRAANSHVIPNKNIIPETLIIRRTTVCNDIESFVRASVPRVCLISMTMMMMKTTTLMAMMAKIGTKKATKKTIGLLRKQLQEKKEDVIGHGSMKYKELLFTFMLYSHLAPGIYLQLLFFLNPLGQGLVLGLTGFSHTMHCAHG